MDLLIKFAGGFTYGTDNIGVVLTTDSSQQADRPEFGGELKQVIFLIITTIEIQRKR
jgi:hypothetical protein